MWSPYIVSASAYLFLSACLTTFIFMPQLRQPTPIFHFPLSRRPFSPPFPFVAPHHCPSTVEWKIDCHAKVNFSFEFWVKWTRWRGSVKSGENVYIKLLSFFSSYPSWLPKAKRFWVRHRKKNCVNLPFDMQNALKSLNYSFYFGWNRKRSWFTLYNWRFGIVVFNFLSNNIFLLNCKSLEKLNR